MISGTVDDKTLISRFISGDQNSGDELAFRYYSRVLSVCFQYLRTAEAQDAAQDVFLKVLGRRKINTFHGEAKLWTWLYRVTVNTCYEHLALRFSRPVTSRSLEEQPWLETCLTVPGFDPEELSVLRLQLERMVRTIYRLRDSYRDPLVLVHLRGYTYAQAAAELGITARALAVRLTRAKKRLAELMKNSRMRRAAGGGTIPTRREVMMNFKEGK